MRRDALSPLAACAGDLMEADERIVALAWGAARDPAAWSAALLEAIAERERLAEAVLKEIAREDRVYQSALAATPVAAAPKLIAHLVRRDRTIEALVDMVETQSREYHRIARQIESASGSRGKRRPHRPL